MRSEIAELALVGHLREAIEEIVKIKIKLGMLTSNFLGNVTQWLKIYNLDHVFDFIQRSRIFLLRDTC